MPKTKWRVGDVCWHNPYGAAYENWPVWYGRGPFRVIKIWKPDHSSNLWLTCEAIDGSLIRGDKEYSWGASIMRRDEFLSAAQRVLARKSKKKASNGE